MVDTLKAEEPLVAEKEDVEESLKVAENIIKYIKSTNQAI